MLRLTSLLLMMTPFVACSADRAESIESRLKDDAAFSAIDIAAFNIRYANNADGLDAWQFRRDEVCQRLAQGSVWGLQEALPSQIEDIRACRPNMEIVARSRDVDPATGESCPILFRTDCWELDPVEHGTFWLSETPEIAGSKSWDSSLPRIATYARLIERVRNAGAVQSLQSSVPRAFYVYNVHLDHRGAIARAEQVKVVLSAIAARRHLDPVVLLGDFNAGPTSEPIRAVLTASPPWTDVWRAANLGVGEQGTFNAWRSDVDSERIDFIFAQGFTVLSASIDASKRSNGRWFSDHMPVRARVCWGSRQ